MTEIDPNDPSTTVFAPTGNFVHTVVIDGACFAFDTAEAANVWASQIKAEYGWEPSIIAKTQVMKMTTLGDFLEA